ncbi:PREDICTED: protein qua-1-like [Ipomoea nil]|uniref:protein qua-1-like n=1 Tax=Ipomoea nil TaxID=35883 RepID=UPI000901D5B1|nr:PREDICTED: protein qua-1-like [Ipomoea nil]
MAREGETREGERDAANGEGKERGRPQRRTQGGGKGRGKGMRGATGGGRRRGLPGDTKNAANGEKGESTKAHGRGGGGGRAKQRPRRNGGKARGREKKKRGKGANQMQRAAQGGNREGNWRPGARSGRSPARRADGEGTKETTRINSGSVDGRGREGPEQRKEKGTQAGVDGATSHGRKRIARNRGDPGGGDAATAKGTAAGGDNRTGMRRGK